MDRPQVKAIAAKITLVESLGYQLAELLKMDSSVHLSIHGVSKKTTTLAKASFDPDAATLEAIRDNLRERIATLNREINEALA